MYKVLIVDDELLARNYICSLVDWERSGFTLCGEAENGREAMMQIALLEPDLVIMDMSMPVMGGVELSEQLAAQYPELQIVVMSSYDDYPYVRQTLKNGAIDYVLKDTVDRPYMAQLLEQVKERLLAQSRERHERQQERLQAEQWKEIVSEQIVRELLIGMKPYDPAAVRHIGMTIAEPGEGGFVVAVMQVSRYSHAAGGSADANKEQFLHSIPMLCRQAWEAPEQMPRYHMCRLEEGRFGFIIPLSGTRSEAVLQQMLIQQTNKLSYMLNQYLNVQVVWGISSRCYEAGKLSRCYKEALAATNVREAGQEVGMVSLTIRQELELLMAVENRDALRVEQLLDSIFTGLENASAAAPRQLLVNDLLMMALKLANENGLDAQQMYDGQCLLPFEDEVTGKKDTDGLRIRELYGKLMEQLLRLAVPEGMSDHGRKALEYIQLHYSKELTLTEVAEHLGLSPAYFSRMFRKETGIGFVEYVNKLRIDKAKQRLLQGERQMKQISREVGFYSYSHFFQQFKALTGTTPAGYVEDLRSGGETG